MCDGLPDCLDLEDEPIFCPYSSNTRREFLNILARVSKEYEAFWTRWAATQVSPDNVTEEIWPAAGQFTVSPPAVMIRGGPHYDPFLAQLIGFSITAVILVCLVAAVIHVFLLLRRQVVVSRRRRSRAGFSDPPEQETSV